MARSRGAVRRAEAALAGWWWVIGARAANASKRSVLLTSALVLGVAGAGLVASQAPDLALRADLRQELAASAAPPSVTAFYAARRYEPVWVEAAGVWPFWTQSRVRPAARERAERVLAVHQQHAALDDARNWSGAAVRRSTLGGLSDGARVEVALTASLAAGAEAVAEARRRELAFVDPAFSSPAPPEEFFQWATSAPSAVDDIRRLNPVHDALAAGLVAYRDQWAALPKARVPVGPTLRAGDRGPRVERLRFRLGLAAGDVFDSKLVAAVRRFQAAHGVPATGAADPDTVAALNLGPAHFEARIVANLRRAQALPPPVGERYILVNPAAGRLWMYEGERLAGSMKVIVGSRREQTPGMAGLIRYMVYNPYWEVPVDIAQAAIAPAALRSGPGYIEARQMQVLSDWGDNASLVSPAAVNWTEVAARRAEVRLRQRPGPENMMGRVKFMMPNELGIYLHDTPDRSLFALEARQLSAGCVRVERAEELAAWIRMDRPLDPAFQGVDQVVDQFAPVTVYVSYLTAGPTPEGVRFYPDVYGRDRAGAGANGAATLADNARAPAV
ncbi:L,D-transpeptidase family protein [Phenylobacterium sp.]|uniref:L,D-transpeptidase family protein n=1 Tax=Phenylobacterium sp. TaxID=1871053 RepID=UPI0035B4D902